MGPPRYICKYHYQHNYKFVSVYTDSDFAGCIKSRKSTSGGSIMKGGHVIKAWAKTQAVIVKSSAESELYDVVKEGLGVCTMLSDLGVARPKVRMHIDANAAKGIIERKGLSKVRHLDTDVLRLQEQQARRLLLCQKCSAQKTLPMS